MASSNNLAGRQLDSSNTTGSDGRMTITRVNSADIVALVVCGELDGVSARSLERCIRREELAGASDIRIDLQHTSFVDAGGIRILVEAARRAGAGGWRFRAVNPRGLVRKVFEITQVDDMIDHWQRDAGRAHPLQPAGLPFDSFV